MNIKSLNECLDNYIRKNNNRNHNVNEDWTDDVSVADLKLYQSRDIPYNQKTHVSTHVDDSGYSNDYHLTQDEVDRIHAYNQQVKLKKSEKAQPQKNTEWQKQVRGKQMKGKYKDKLSDEEIHELIKIWADMDCHNPYMTITMDLIRFQEQCYDEGIYNNTEELFKEYRQLVKSIREKEHLPKSRRVRKSKNAESDDWVEKFGLNNDVDEDI